MTASAHEFNNVAQTKCAHCGQPFCIKSNQVECWRGSDGKFFCNEFCGDDAEEAAFQSRSRAP
jgi:hypothetical protein